MTTKTETKANAYEKYEATTSRSLLQIVQIIGRASNELDGFRTIKEQQRERQPTGKEKAELAKQALEHIKEITAELNHLDDLLEPIIEMAVFFENGCKQAMERAEQEIAS